MNKKELKDIIVRAKLAFHEELSDGKAAAKMLEILEEVDLDKDE